MANRRLPSQLLTIRLRLQLSRQGIMVTRLGQKRPKGAARRQTHCKLLAASCYPDR